jgi:hypothetical protein
MALNASGAISLAGTTAGQSIQVELGGNGTTTITLNDTTVRTLAGIASGAISLSNFWGKSNVSYWANYFSTNVNIADAQGPHSTEIDSSGNVYLCTVSYSLTTISNVYSLYVFKFDGSGTLLWGREFRQTSGYGHPTTSQVSSLNIKVDSSGNVNVCGLTSRDNSGPGQLSPDVIMVKWNSSGVLQWYKSLYYTNTNSSSLAIPSSSIDDAGNFYITGATPVSGTTDTPIVVQKYDTAGNLSWSRAIQNTLAPSNRYIWDAGVAASPNGNDIYVNSQAQAVTISAPIPASQYSPAYTYRRGRTTAYVPASYYAYSYNTYTYAYAEWLLKYNGSGTLQWARNKVTYSYSYNQLADMKASNSNLHLMMPDASLSVYDNSGYACTVYPTGVAYSNTNRVNIDPTSGNIAVLANNGNRIYVFSSSMAYLYSMQNNGAGTGVQWQYLQNIGFKSDTMAFAQTFNIQNGALVAYYNPGSPGTRYSSGTPAGVYYSGQYYTKTAVAKVVKSQAGLNSLNGQVLSPYNTVSTAAYPAPLPITSTYNVLTTASGVSDTAGTGTGSFVATGTFAESDAVPVLYTPVQKITIA